MISRTILDLFVKFLDGKALGQNLSPEVIKDAMNEFLDQENRYLIFYRTSSSQCQYLFEQALWDKQRHDFLDRILVQQFSHLFHNPDDLEEKGSGEISRRVIPGFSLAIRKMLGPELTEQCEHKCQAIGERHRDSEVGVIRWSELYQDPDVCNLVNDILFNIAHHFSNYERRKEWFIELVNGHLGRHRRGEDKSWKLDEHGLVLILKALFQDIERQLLENNGEALKIRHGELDVEFVQDFINSLNAPKVVNETT